MKTYMVRRVLQTADGRGHVVLNVKCFESPDDAVKACEQQSQLLRRFAGCVLYSPEGENMRMTAGEFMGEVGIVGFSSQVDSVDVVSLIAVPSKIIVP